MAPSATVRHRRCCTPERWSHRPEIVCRSTLGRPRLFTFGLAVAKGTPSVWPNNASGVAASLRALSSAIACADATARSTSSSVSESRAAAISRSSCFFNHGNGGVPSSSHSDSATVANRSAFSWAPPLAAMRAEVSRQAANFRRSCNGPYPRGVAERITKANAASLLQIVAPRHRSPAECRCGATGIRSRSYPLGSVGQLWLPPATANGWTACRARSSHAS